MHYKLPKNRNELLLDTHIENWIAQNNVVRLIDLIVDKFVDANSFLSAGTSKLGCKGYSPATMLKLLLYCYFNWIPGSRRMEKETYRNIEVMWLLGELRPDHWTICKFRRENRELIRKAAISFRKFLVENGYIEGKTIVFDGSKMKAYASRDMLSEKVLADRISNIEQQIEKYLDNADETDNLEEMLEEEALENQELTNKIEKLEAEKNKLEGVKKQMEKLGVKYLSPSDPDARLMKSRDGKMACYNAQTGVDSKHHMIALAEVTTDECDIKLLKEDFENLKDQLGIIPEEVVADKGYANIDHIKELCQNPKTKCYIPMPDSPAKTKDKKNGIEFKYDEQDDTFICPNSKKLHLVRKRNKKNNKTYDRYQCKDCQGCPIRHKCTQSKIGRMINIFEEEHWKKGYKKWLEQPDNMGRIKKRGKIVEHPYGTIKMIMGKFCFLLRKKPKVQVELDIYSTIYNLKRLINIENMNNLFQMVENYKWAIA